MDIKIEKKKGIKAIFRKKNLPYLLVLFFIVFVSWLIFRDNSATLKIDARMISISEVAEGEFNDYVRVTGQVHPITSVQMSPLEAGIVEEIIVEEGATVKKGDIIMILSNSQLNLSILNSEAQLAENENHLRNTMVVMEQERLNLRLEQLQLNFDVKQKQRTYEQNEELYSEKLIAKEVWLKSREDYELSLSRRDLVMERQKQDSIYRSVQVERMEGNLDNMEENMRLIHQREDNLNVKSPIDGEIGLLDVVLGQSVSMGQKVGQINDLSNYKIEANIAEHYIDRIRSGLEATFDRQDMTFFTSLRKVYPEVRDGQFRADFKFTGDRPDNIRTGQTYYLNLQLGQSTEAILIPRGSFFQSTGGSWIFVVDESGEKAYKREIKIGRQNPQYYEVTEGLESGEKVITSSYDSYGDNDVLILNK